KAGFIDGSIPEPPTGTVEHKAWERCNDLIITWLHANLDSTIKKSVLFLRTAREIWEDLEERFGYASMAQIYAFEQKLSEIKQEIISVFGFYTEIKTLWDEMQDASPLQCTDDEASAKTEAYIMFAQEERHREVLEENSQSEALAFVAKKNHTIESVIRFMDIHNILNHSKKRKLQQLILIIQEISDKITQEQFEQLLSLHDNQVKQDDNVTHEIQQSDSGHAMLAGKYCFVCSNNSEWLLDSGAIDHMCYNLECFHSYEKLKGENNFITIPDGRRVKVTHKGTVILNGTINLEHVLFVTDFKYNLISIHKLCKDLHCSVIFTDSECYI
ncbi:Retrovirus-related Pol polyprotein from transposon RE2, partial [Bienertia sinuspersici]